MDADWKRLGRALAAARRTAGLTQAQVADAIDVTRTPIQAIERGVPVARPTGTMRAYAQLVGWTPDSIETVLAGGEPTNSKTTQAAESASDLPLRIVEEMGAGQLLDTTVLDLTPDGSGARMIVVVRGAPDATPEDIRRDLLAWRRTQRHLQDLGDESDSSDGPAAGQA